MIIFQPLTLTEHEQIRSSVLWLRSLHIQAYHLYIITLLSYVKHTLYVFFLRNLSGIRS